MFDDKLLNHKNLVKHHELFDGVQYFYRVNDYTSYSVIRHSCSYGGNKGFYEVAPIALYENEFDIKGEPIGWLTVDEVLEMLEGKRYGIQSRR
ncbi:hypothetical protein [Mammaliicoccus sciuri]|uniref:hypothetical protein n=1 Tax=Mammaliicoccus sciuri TaxID=1296 RepID=UPI002DB609CA|nr:hypothetical protein [Mammaliicoccus sciuri]MEB6231424.1 hypothetical protein [Mammaliicoccus sciuri]